MAAAAEGLSGAAARAAGNGPGARPAAALALAGRASGGVGAARAAQPAAGGERRRRGGLGGGEESLRGGGKTPPHLSGPNLPQPENSGGPRAAGPASCGVSPGLAPPSVPVLDPRGGRRVSPMRSDGHRWPGQGRAPRGCPLGPESRTLLAAPRSVLLPQRRPGWRRAQLPAFRPGTSLLFARPIPSQEK